MRHVILFVLAIAAAFWLAPALHVLPQHAKSVAEVAIIGMFAAVDIVIGLAGRRPTARTTQPVRRRAASVRR